jgi:hypothetical protein
MGSQLLLGQLFKLSLLNVGFSSMLRLHSCVVPAPGSPRGPNQLVLGSLSAADKGFVWPCDSSKTCKCWYSRFERRGNVAREWQYTARISSAHFWHFLKGFINFRAASGIASFASKFHTSPVRPHREIFTSLEQQGRLEAPPPWGDECHCWPGWW